MYYDHPDYDEAYLTDASGTFSQYMFGPSILVAPIVKQGQQFLGGGLLTSKSVWLPPGSWYNTLTGDVTASSSVIFTRNYTLNDIPMWCAAQPLPPPPTKTPFHFPRCRYRAGAVIPYLPLRALPVVGLASKPYSFLAFR